jgi:hypothetical protein
MLLSRLRARLAASAARVSRPRALGAVAGTGVATAAAVYNSAVFASDGVLAPTPMPWDFDGYLTTYDAAAVRRGHQVYSQVCASCHGLRAIAYRNLVGVCYSEEEAKAMAEDIDCWIFPVGLYLRRGSAIAPRLFPRRSSGCRWPAPHHSLRAANPGMLDLGMNLVGSNRPLTARPKEQPKAVVSRPGSGRG